MPYIPDLKPAEGQFSPATPSVRAAMAPGEALGDLAKGVASTAVPLAKIASRLHKADNARLESEARTRWTRDQAQLMEDLRNDPDPRNHLRRADEIISNSKAELDQANLPPEVRARLREDHGIFASKLQLDAAQGADALAIRSTEEAINREAGEAMRLNDREAYGRAITNRVTTFGASPGEIAGAWSMFEKNSLMLDLEKSIKDDPIAARKRLAADDFLRKSPDVTEQERRRALSMAEATIEHKREEQVSLLRDALMDKKLEPDDLEAAEYITDRDRASFTRALKASTPPSNEAHSRAWQHLDSLRQARNSSNTTEQQYRQLFNEKRATVMDLIAPQWQGDIQQELSILTPAGRADGQRRFTPIDGNDLLAISRGSVDRALQSGVLGDLSPAAPYAVREAAYRKAEDIRINIKSRFGDIGSVPHDKRGEYISNVRAETDRQIAANIDGATSAISPTPAEVDYGKDPELRSIIADPPADAVQRPPQTASGTTGSSPATHPPTN